MVLLQQHLKLLQIEWRRIIRSSIQHVISDVWSSFYFLHQIFFVEAEIWGRANFSYLPRAPLLDNLATESCTYAVYSGLSEIIAVFGAFTNIINIICFVEQSLNESISIGLLVKNKKKIFRKILIVSILVL